MLENEAARLANEAARRACCQFPESIRLLWEAMYKALEDWGLDDGDVAALCDLIVRLADDRLRVIEVNGSLPGSEEIANRVRHYRQLAADLLQKATAPTPEPDWEEVSDKLRAAGAAPLDLPACPKE
jgi:hypothetical protein